MHFANESYPLFYWWLERGLERKKAFFHFYSPSNWVLKKSTVERRSYNLRAMKIWS